MFTADTMERIWREVTANLPMATQVAEFYHMATHVHECTEILFPNEEDLRRDRAGALLGVMKHGGG